MKRLLLAFCLSITAFVAIAQTTPMRLDMLSPKDPRTMGMGGAFVAMSQGYQSFYGNPSSFASDKGELTLLSINPWVYVSPTTENFNNFTSIFNSLSGSSGSATDTGAIIGTVEELLTGNGFGLGTSAGLGWVGKKIAIGFVASVDAYLHGPNLLGVRGNLDEQAAIIVGLGFPVDIGPFKFHVGGDIRPFVRATSLIGVKELAVVMNAMGVDIPTTIPTGTAAPAPTDNPFLALPVNIGFGLAVDLGVDMVVLPEFLNVGLSIRDITTKQRFSKMTIGEAIDMFATSTSLPPGQDVDFAVYPNLTLGASLTPIPKGMRKLLDLIVVLEIQDPIRAYKDRASIWNLMHLGAEAQLLGGFVKARAGLNKGYISMGAGLDLFISEVNVAVFTEELGRRPGDRPRTGMTAEVTFRF